MISWIQENVKKAAAMLMALGAALSEILQRVSDWLLG